MLRVLISASFDFFSFASASAFWLKKQYHFGLEFLLFVSFEVLVKILMVHFQHFLALFKGLLFFLGRLLQSLNFVLNDPVRHRHQEHLLFLLNQVNDRFLHRVFIIRPQRYYIKGLLYQLFFLIIIGRLRLKFFVDWSFEVFVMLQRSLISSRFFLPDFQILFLTFILFCVLYKYFIVIWQSEWRIYHFTVDVWQCHPSFLLILIHIQLN